MSVNDLDTRTIEPASRPQQRQAAEVRRKAYPYKFPRDQRKMGGKYTVEENSRRLLRWFYLERRLSHGLGSWTLTIPDFEVKIETGRHIFWHMDAARKLRERLTEQEMRQKAIDGFHDEDIDRFIDEVLSASDTPELLVGIHLVAGKALEVAYRHHIDDTCPVTDAPTIRVLRQILLDYEPMLAWAEQAIAAYIDGGVDESRLERWHWHLSRLLASIGGVTGADERAQAPAPLRIDSKPYERGTVPSRDSRFDTFRNTVTTTLPIVRRVTKSAAMKMPACALCAPNATKWMPSKHSALSCGISASRTSRPNTTFHASPGMRHAILRLATRRCWPLAMIPTSCPTGSPLAPAVDRWSRPTPWPRSISLVR